MGQALYRKYRSRSLDEVVGQEHVTHTLSEALKQGRISHAYLFTGPRGVGKTSVARILAHQINDLPYDNDTSHMDIIEIDAASNRRIDEIRELREKVFVAPTSAKYKVYIIDEVHMLTREAFNALLKTLEEPPAHVVFILATTDAHKLPETIVSRTQRFSFRPADDAKVVGLLKKIAKAEKIDVSDKALSVIAKHGGGSFRDSVSLLDQAGSQGSRVEAANIEQLLGLPPTESVDNLLRLAISGSGSAVLIKALSAMYDQGYQAAAISRQLGQALREQLAGATTPANLDNLLQLLSQLVEVPVSHDPERALEIALLRSNPSLFIQATVKQEPEISEELPPEELPSTKIIPKAESPTSQVTESVKKQIFGSEIWPEVLRALKQKYNTLYGVIRMAEPDFSKDGKLRLAFSFSFHQKRLNENSNRQKLVDTIYELTGQTVDVECIVDKSAQPPKITIKTEKRSVIKQSEKPDVNDLSAISNIFGNAELLES